MVVFLPADLARYLQTIKKKEYQRLYRSNNLEKIKQYPSNSKERRKLSQQKYSSKEENKWKKSKNSKEYYQKTKHKKCKDKKKISDKKYYEKNKIKINTKCKKYRKIRRAKDIVFKLRNSVSKSISRALKRQCGSKNGSSCFKNLNYNLLDLTNHLQQSFDPWMNLNNYGKYDPKTWDDHDQATWTWNIDHVIPQSELPYFSMEEENFRKCWSLENLRPYSSKQNFLDGIYRIRHTKGNKDG